MLFKHDKINVFQINLDLETERILTSGHFLHPNTYINDMMNSVVIGVSDVDSNRLECETIALLSSLDSDGTGD